MATRLRRSLIAALGAATLALPPSMALAQEQSLAASPVASPVAQPDGPDGDLAAIFPAELGGAPWMELELRTGHEIVAEFDPDDPSDAAQIADVEALLEAAGVPLDEITIASGFRIDETGEHLTVLGAIRVRGLDPLAVLDLLEAWFLPRLAQNLREPRQEVAQIEGRDVVLLHDDGAINGRPFHFIVIGDTIWFFNVAEELLAEVFEKLP